jgi:hypothetical protein
LKVIELVVTVPVTVTVPAVPLPAPKIAELVVRFGQATFVVPFHQFVPDALVLHVPPPSCGLAVAGSASHVTCALAGIANTRVMTAANPATSRNLVGCIIFSTPNEINSGINPDSQSVRAVGKCTIQAVLVKTPERNLLFGKKIPRTEVANQENWL